jgi:hypothetical protein
MGLFARATLLPAAMLFSVTLCAPAAGRAEPAITVAVRFHIVTDLTMVKEGTVMQSWVSARDVERTVLPEINRIWRPAGIGFALDRVLVTPALRPPDRRQLVRGIVDAKRDSDGKSDPGRIKKLNQLVDWSSHDAGMINVYLVPYLGERSQGNGERKQRRVFSGQWTDKPSGARRPPERFRLTEVAPFRKGSLSRTVAHEIGHILGLRHPEKAAQTELGLLMGGRRPGYRLTAREIAVARSHAAELSGD